MGLQAARAALIRLDPESVEVYFGAVGKSVPCPDGGQLGPGDLPLVANARRGLEGWIEILSKSITPWITPEYTKIQTPVAWIDADKTHQFAVYPVLSPIPPSHAASGSTYVKRTVFDGRISQKSPEPG